MLGCSLISKSGTDESVLHGFCDHLQGEGGARRVHCSEVTMHAFEARNVWSFIISLLPPNPAVSPLCMLDGERGLQCGMEHPFTI